MTRIPRKELGIIITGQDDIDKKLRFLPKALQIHIVQQATDKASKEIVLPDALRRVPYETGLLAGSLDVVSDKITKTRFELRETKSKTVGLQKVKGQLKRIPGVVGSSVFTRRIIFGREYFYGTAQELGTKHLIKGDGDSQEETHSPFLRPAIYDNQLRVTQVFLNAMRQFIRKPPLE